MPIVEPKTILQLLYVSSHKKKVEENFQDILCVEEESFMNEDVQTNELETLDLNSYKNDVIEHISGFVVKQ